MTGHLKAIRYTNGSKRRVTRSRQGAGKTVGEIAQSRSEGERASDTRAGQLGGLQVMIDSGGRVAELPRRGVWWNGLLLLTAAGLLAGCEAWLDVNDPQCRSDDTCVALLGDGATCGAGGVCVAKMVQDAAGDDGP